MGWTEGLDQELTFPEEAVLLVALHDCSVEARLQLRTATRSRRGRAQPLCFEAAQGPHINTLMLDASKAKGCRRPTDAGSAPVALQSEPTSTPWDSLRLQSPRHPAIAYANERTDALARGASLGALVRETRQTSTAGVS